ncbi:MAG: histidinol dehydrogenase [Gemmatimonadota bacterium]
MSALTWAYRGPAAPLPAAAREALFARATMTDDAVRSAVTAQLAAVRADGDDALRRFAATFDHVDALTLEVPRAEWMRALEAIDPTLRAVLERAVRNLREVHAAFRPTPREMTTADGVVIGRRPDPLACVGVYAPGGRAAYPSSVLMGAVPARVAGVGEVILCTPPGRDGRPSDVVLAAAAIADVNRVFAVGGAGAVGAMAFGTATIPAVDRIVGPGNAYVAEAKAQVAGTVAIDSPAGPSELLVLGDASADPALVARELLAQAEHDPVAAVVLVTDSASLETATLDALEGLVASAPRGAIVRAALAARGAVVRVASLDEGIAFSNAWAPEHLLLAVRPDREAACLDALRHAGTIFLGAAPSVAFGDYLTGANHVLPTGGAARAFSGLSTDDFVRWTTYQRVPRTAAAALAGDVGRFADAEGLPGHAAAARAWEGR